MEEDANNVREDTSNTQDTDIKIFAYGPRSIWPRPEINIELLKGMTKAKLQRPKTILIDNID